MRAAIACFAIVTALCGSLALATVEAPIPVVKLWNYGDDDSDIASIIAAMDWYPSNTGHELVGIAEKYRYVDVGGNFIVAVSDLRIKIYNDDGTLNNRFDLITHRTDPFPDPGHPDFQAGGADPVFYTGFFGDNTPTTGTADERREQVADGYLNLQFGIGVASDATGRVLVMSQSSFTAYFSSGLGANFTERFVIRTYDMSTGGFLCQLVVPLENLKGELENAMSGVGDFRNGDNVDEIMLSRTIIDGVTSAETWTSEFFNIRTCARLSSPDDKVTYTVTP